MLQFIAILKTKAGNFPCLHRKFSNSSVNQSFPPFFPVLPIRPPALKIRRTSQIFPTIFSGFTHSSNCSGVTYPNFTAISFNVVPSLWAFCAISAAL